MRRQLVNTTASFLCPNCIGGILFHDLGLKFQSPTVNLMMFQQDFARYVLRLEHYQNQKLLFYKDPSYSCPCARLDDITIHFTHYATEAEAEQKWIERSKRLNIDNLFVFLEERDALTYEQMQLLGKLDLKGLVIFTANKYPDLPYCLYLPDYEKDGEVGNILEKNRLDDSRRYEKYFDFVKWFNEAAGSGYDITPFSRVR